MNETAKVRAEWQQADCTLFGPPLPWVLDCQILLLPVWRPKKLIASNRSGDKYDFERRAEHDARPNQSTRHPRPALEPSKGGSTMDTPARNTIDTVIPTNDRNAIDITPPEVEAMSSRGGSSFLRHVENIIATQVDGLPDGTTFTVGTVPGGAAPLITFAGYAAGGRVDLRSLNGQVVHLNPRAAAAAISYVAVGWLMWNIHKAGLGNPPNGSEVMHAAVAQFRALRSYIFEGTNFTAVERSAIIAYTD